MISLRILTLFWMPSLREADVRADWPVLLLAETYQGWFSLVKNSVAGLTETEQIVSGAEQRRRRIPSSGVETGSTQNQSCRGHAGGGYKTLGKLPFRCQAIKSQPASG